MSFGALTREYNMPVFVCDNNDNKNGCDSISRIKLLFAFYCRCVMALMCVNFGFTPATSNNLFNLWSCQSVESHSAVFHVAA